MAMIGRAFYLLFVVLFGWPFMLLNWLLRGTRGGRQRQAMVRQQRKTNKLLAGQTRLMTAPPQPQLRRPTYWYGDRPKAIPPTNYGVRSDDGQWWWDGQQWQPVPSEG